MNELGYRDGFQAGFTKVAIEKQAFFGPLISAGMKAMPSLIMGAGKRIAGSSLGQMSLYQAGSALVGKVMRPKGPAGRNLAKSTIPGISRNRSGPV